MGRRIRGVVGAVVALLGYAAAVAWLTWPLAARMWTHLPSRHPDNLLLAWVLSEQGRAIAGEAVAGGIYHPTAQSVFYGEAAIGALPYFLPVLWTTDNPALALNVTFFSGVVLSALGLHLAVARWTGSSLAAVLAAWTFLLTPWTLRDWTRIAPTYAVLQYFPIVMFILTGAGLGVLRLSVLGGALLAQALVSPYLAAAACAPVAVVAAARLRKPASRRDGLDVVLVLLLVGAALVAAYGGYRDVARANPELDVQSLYRSLGFDIPRFPADLARASWPTAVPAPCLVVILLGGLAHLLGGGGHSAQVRAAWRQAMLWTALGVVFCFGRRVEVAGHLVLTPWGGLQQLVPGMAVLRDPRRLGVLALFGLAVLTGLGFHACAGRLSHARGWSGPAGRAALAVGLAAAMLHGYGSRLRTPSPRDRLFGYRQVALGLRPAPTTDSALLDILAAGSGPLLEVPIGPGPEAHAVAMYRAIAHHRPLVNGYHGYWPAEFPQRMPRVPVAGPGGGSGPASRDRGGADPRPPGGPQGPRPGREPAVRV